MSVVPHFQLISVMNNPTDVPNSFRRIESSGIYQSGTEYSGLGLYCFLSEINPV